MERTQQDPLWGRGRVPPLSTSPNLEFLPRPLHSPRMDSLQWPRSCLLLTTSHQEVLAAQAEVPLVSEAPGPPAAVANTHPTHQVSLGHLIHSHDTAGKNSLFNWSDGNPLPIDRFTCHCTSHLSLGVTTGNRATCMWKVGDSLEVT